MSSKKSRTDPASAPASQDIDQLCKADQKQLIDALATLRARAAPGRFGEIDRLLGLKPGWLGRVFRGEKTLSHPRLLLLIRLLGDRPSRFFARVFPTHYDPTAPIGLLPRLVERQSRVEPPAWRNRLLEWSRTLKISRNGKRFDFDPADLIALRLRDSSAAEGFGIFNLEYFLTFSQGTLATSSAVPLAKWLTCLAFILRVRGDRSTAAELCDVALQIEARVDDSDCRSFILRNACYVASDLGCLDEAADFAHQAIRLSISTGDLLGIGLSHYALGVISSYRGDGDLAIEMYEISLRYLDENHLDSRACAAVSISMLRLEQGALKAADTSLGTIDVSTDKLSEGTQARICLAQAELNSQKGHPLDAEREFTKAVEIFDRLGAVSDIALVGLFQIRHCLRHNRRGQFQEQTRKLLTLGSDPRIGKIGQAILLEIARQCYRDDVNVHLVGSMIEQWQDQSRKPASQVTSC